MEEISLIISIPVLIPNENAKPSFQDIIVNYLRLSAKTHSRQLSKREGIGNQPRYSHKHWFHYKIPTNLDTYLKMHCLVHHSGTLDELYLVLFADIKRSSFASSFGLHKYEMLFPRFQFKAGLEDARYSVFIFLWTLSF